MFYAKVIWIKEPMSWLGEQKERSSYVEIEDDSLVYNYEVMIKNGCRFEAQPTRRTPSLSTLEEVNLTLNPKKEISLFFKVVKNESGKIKETFEKFLRDFTLLKLNTHISECREEVCDLIPCHGLELSTEELNALSEQSIQKAKQKCFVDHLDKATETVSKWPKWKRNVLSRVFNKNND